MQLTLNGEWKLYYHPQEEAMPPIEEWPAISARVPGEAELALMEEEPDPFMTRICIAIANMKPIWGL